jgi:CRISPR-associated protein Cas5t
VSELPALHIRLEALSASFRYPLTISGTQISTSVPAYSNILGIISVCAGRFVKPSETRVGFEFACRSHWLELQKTSRLKMDKQRRLQSHGKGQGISFRQVYSFPSLDLYISNLDLAAAFERPASTPCFGRSQDIAWIKSVQQVALRPAPKGSIGPTLIPYPQQGVAGLLVRLPEWFDNDRPGYPRRPGPFGRYQAMPSAVKGLRFEIERSDLFHPSDAENATDVIYLHQWMRDDRLHIS